MRDSLQVSLAHLDSFIFCLLAHGPVRCAILRAILIRPEERRIFLCTHLRVVPKAKRHCTSLGKRVKSDSKIYKENESKTFKRQSIQSKSLCCLRFSCIFFREKRQRTTFAVATALPASLSSLVVF